MTAGTDGVEGCRKRQSSRGLEITYIVGATPAQALEAGPLGPPRKHNHCHPCTRLATHVAAPPITVNKMVSGGRVAGREGDSRILAARPGETRIATDTS